MALRFTVTECSCIYPCLLRVSSFLFFFSPHLFLSFPPLSSSLVMLIVKQIEKINYQPSKIFTPGYAVSPPPGDKSRCKPLINKKKLPKNESWQYHHLTSPLPIKPNQPLAAYIHHLRISAGRLPPFSNRRFYRGLGSEALQVCKKDGSEPCVRPPLFKASHR